MIRRLLPPLTLAVALLARGDTTQAGDLAGSALALPLLAPGERPELTLLQRTIDRSWGPSEDSTYVEIAVPDWRSEGWAFALSAAVPGAGHAYLRENGGGLFFALLEIGAWTARERFQSEAEDLQSQAIRFLGTPTDSSATWSFRRWESLTGRDASELRALYEVDSRAFYERIARDPLYQQGWVIRPTAPRETFRHMLDREEGMLGRKRYATTTIWLNHLAAGLDALRAARIGNLTLGQNTRVKLKADWHHGSPTMSATLTRSF
jgi:hypothetical protein